MELIYRFIYIDQTNLLVPSTSLPIDQTQRTFSFRSKIRMSASFPRANEPLRSAMLINRAGVSEAIRMASANGISAFCTIIWTNLSIVARLPAKEEWSASLHTPSSMIKRGSTSGCSQAAYETASVTRHVFSTPFN